MSRGELRAEGRGVARTREVQAKTDGPDDIGCVLAPIQSNGHHFPRVILGHGCKQHEPGHAGGHSQAQQATSFSQLDPSYVQPTPKGQKRRGRQEPGGVLQGTSTVRDGAPQVFHGMRGFS